MEPSLLRRSCFCFNFKCSEGDGAVRLDLPHSWVRIELRVFNQQIEHLAVTLARAHLIRPFSQLLLASGSFKKQALPFF